jgi:hypothetical protein
MMKRYDVTGFLVFCGVSLVGGGLAMFLGEARWVRAAGTVAFMPPFIAALLLGYGWVVTRIVRLCGGDPSRGWVGLLIFLSFAFFALPIFLRLFGRWTGAFQL